MHAVAARCMLNRARCMHAVCTPCTLYETDQARYPAMRHHTYSAYEAARPWRRTCPPQGVYLDGPRSAWCISAPSAAGCPRARRPPQPPSRPRQGPPWRAHMCGLEDEASCSSVLVGSLLRIRAGSLSSARVLVTCRRLAVARGHAERTFQQTTESGPV